MSLAGGMLAALLCGLLISCTWHHRPDTARSGGTNQASARPTDCPTDQFSNPRLLEQLKTEQGIEEPFAWWSWHGVEDGGTVIGLDNQGLLKTVEFRESSGGYVVSLPELPHVLRAPNWHSGDLDLRRCLPNTEVPFRSSIIPMNGCNVHFVLVWQALNRCFERRSASAAFLDAIQLRTIVERDGAIVSNELEKLLLKT